MIQCSMTGVEMVLQEAYALDVYEARLALRDLANRMKAVEKLVTMFGIPDSIEKINPVDRSVRIKKQHRLVSRAVATALGEVCPGRNLFIPFLELSPKIRERARGRNARAQTIPERINSPLAIQVRGDSDGRNS